MDNIFAFSLKFFKWILSSTLMAMVLVFLILIAKNIFKYKLGAKWHYFIWFVLVFRMLLPWAPESSFSVFNILSFEKQTAIIQTTNQEEHNIQVKIVNPVSSGTQVNESNNQADSTTINAPQNPSSIGYVKKLTINLKMLCWIWLITALIFGLYTLLIA